jgi:hypothetical protein
MKPLNLDNRPCSPISSNCVIWQGPDIPCIKLCAGDTVSDVIASLGQELCTIMDQLNISNYDLECIGIAGCPPSDIKTLIELLISKVCDLNNTPQTDTRSTGNCPDCVVSVAPCFVQGTQSTMQLVDYVQMIANRVCAIVTEILAINNQLQEVNNTLIDLQIQIDNIPTYTLPSIPVSCILTPGSYPLDQALDALLNNSTTGYCSLLSRTGTPAQITSSVLSQCILDSSQSLASLAAGDSPVQSFSSYYSGTWVNNANLTSSPTLANAIKNIWISICDMYTYITNLNLSISTQNTSSVNLELNSGVLTAHVQDTGWVNLLGFNYYTGGMSNQKPQCRRIGNVLHFRGVVYVPLATSTGGTTVIDITSPTTYFTSTQITPFQASGGVFIDPLGFMYFNSNGTSGQSVIPNTIVDAGTTLDNTYRLYQTAFRKITVASTNTVTLTANIGISINPNKQLVLTSLEVFEEEGSLTTLYGSPYRITTSNIRSGENIPNYINSNSDIHNFPSTGTQDLVTETHTQTWPFSCDASKPAQIGGFGFVLDGLIAYLDPCTEDVKNRNCPENR